jgi:hypothetical protein
MRNALAALVLLACAPQAQEREPLIDLPRDPSGDEGDDPLGETEDPCEVDQDPSCGCELAPVDIDLGRADVPVAIRGTTAGAGDDELDVCFGLFTEGNPELRYGWTAPRDGTYTVTIEGAWISVDRRACGGGGETCIHQAVTMRRGESISIAVVGLHGSEVAFTLRIERVPSEWGFCGNGVDDDADGATDCADADCPQVSADLDLGSPVPVDAFGTTAGAGDDSPLTCARARSGGAEEHVYAFRAPKTGAYLAYLTEPERLSALLVGVFEPLCPHAELVCEAPWERALFEAAAGQEVFVQVQSERDDLAGSYALHIVDADACADVELPSAEEVASGGSFAAYGNTWDNPYAPGYDVSFAFTAPSTGIYRVWEDRTSTGDAFMVRDARCQRGIPLFGVGGDAGVWTHLDAGERVVFILSRSDPSLTVFNFHVEKQ